jgi:hypothetical protein
MCAAPQSGAANLCICYKVGASFTGNLPSATLDYIDVAYQRRPSFGGIDHETSSTATLCAPFEARCPAQQQGRAGGVARSGRAKSRRPRCAARRRAQSGRRTPGGAGVPARPRFGTGCLTLPEPSWAVLTTNKKISGFVIKSRGNFLAVCRRRGFLLVRHICIHFYFPALKKRHAFCVHLFGTYPNATKQLN